MERLLPSIILFLDLPQLPSIKFTLETENSDSLNFLDLTIYRVNDSLEFLIFRKPTYTDHAINYFSNHHPSQKHAFFHSLIHRLIHIPLSPHFFSKEPRLIHHIANANGYPSSLINTILRRKERNFLLSKCFSPTTDDSIKPRWTRLLFAGQISFNIVNSFPREKIRPAFYNNQNIGNVLLNGKDKLDKLCRSGIYKLCCENCDAVYIGQTGRSFNTRRKEHERAFLSNNLCFTFCETPPGKSSFV